MGTATDLPSLSVNGGPGDDLVNFTANVSFVAGANLDVDLQGEGSSTNGDQCIIGGAQLALSGAGSATIKASHGVQVQASGRISVVDGSIVIEGNLQEPPLTDNFNAVSIAGELRSTGTGGITLNGRAGAGAAITAGVELKGGTLSSTGAGKIAITGTINGDSTTTSLGVQVKLGTINSAGDLTISGTGGVGTTSTGIAFESGTVGGTAKISLTGIGATQGILIANSVTTTSELNLNSDKLTIDPATASLSGGTAQILPITAARLIGLGGADSATALGLTDAELDRVTAATLKIGNTSSGSITLTTDLSRPGSLELRSGSTIALDNALAIGGDVLLDATTVVQSTSTALDFDLSTGAPGKLTFSSGDTLKLQIPAQTGYDTVQVKGGVNLAGVGLQLLGVYVPKPFGECFTLIDNDGTDAIEGQFNNLAEGADVFLNTKKMTLSYVGGDGNDVVLTTAPDYQVSLAAGIGGTQIHIDNLSGTSDTLSVTQSAAGNIQFSAAGRKFKVDNGPVRGDNSGVLTIPALATELLIEGGDGDDVIAIGSFTGMSSLKVNGGKGNDSVRFNGDITFVSGASLDTNLSDDDATAPGIDDCQITGKLQFTGTGSALVDVTRNIAVGITGGISVADGALNLNAHQQTPPLTENFTAIDLAGTLASSGTGNIQLTGRGVAGAVEAHGVLIRGGSITSSGTGTVYLGGEVLGTTSVMHTGVTFSSGTITSAGDVAIIGINGSTGVWHAGSIICQGTAKLSITGTATDSDATTRGVFIGGGISTENQPVILTGISLNTVAGSDSNHGLALTSSIQLGTGELILLGSGSTVGANTYDIDIGSAASLTAATQHISSPRVRLWSATLSAATALNLTADTLAIQSGATLSGGIVEILPLTSGRLVDLGAADSSTQLGLAADELSRITASILNIGDTSTGNITVSANVACTGDVSLTSHDAITFPSGGISTTGSVTVNAGTTVSTPFTGTDVSGTGLTFGSGKTLETGIRSNTDLDTLKVAGTVDLTGVALQTTSTYVPKPGDSLLLVDNDGTDAITGTFNGLANGIKTVFNGVNVYPVYDGGDGNDLELYAPGDPTFTPTGVPAVLDKTGLFHHTLTITNPGPMSMAGVRITVMNLPPGIKLWNATHPFLPVLEDRTVIARRSSRDITVTFYTATRNLGTWVPQYRIENFSRGLDDLPGDLTGAFSALIERTDGINPKTGSRVDLTMSKTGAYSGSLTSEGLKTSFKGLLGIDPINPAKPLLSTAFLKTGLTLALNFDAKNLITGELRPTSLAAGAPGPRAKASGWRKVWTPATKTAPANLATGYRGRHNFSLEHTATVPNSPPGYGYGSITVTKDDGSFTVAGKLADGTPITTASFVGPDGQALVFSPLYTNTGSVLGSLTITLKRPSVGNPVPIPNPVSGQLNWKKLTSTNAKERNYKAGFDSITLDCEGGLYTLPAQGQNLKTLPITIAGAANAVLEFIDGGLGVHTGFAQLLRIYNPSATGTVNRLQNTAPTPYTVLVTTFDSNTGLFGGKFIVPGQGTVATRSATFAGQLVPTTDLLLGVGFSLVPRVPVAPETGSTSAILSGKVHFWDNRVPRP